MREEDYIAYAFTDLDAPPPVDRRDFLKLLGGGIVIFIALGDLLSAQDPRPGRRSRQRGRVDFNAFLRVAEDGKVTCFSGKVEMGQGVFTSLPQMLAEELDVPLDSVDMVLGDTETCPWDMGTFGSMTTRFFGPSLRKAGAEARSVLLDLAAEHLAVPRERLATEAGAVFDPDNPDTRVSYGELAKGKRIQRVVSQAAVVKSAAELAVIGRSVVATEAERKVRGEPVYAGDVRLPGMLYARVLRPPAHGAKLASLDTSAAEKLDGVRVVRAGELVAALHATPDGAGAAIEQIHAEWELPDLDVDDETIFDYLIEKAPPPTTFDRGGKLETGEKQAAEIVESRFTAAYVAHAPMENHTAVVAIEDGKADVWASTQTPFSARDSVARALGMKAEDVRVRATFLGGGFGGKAHNPQVVEAARLCKLAGVPIHLEWTRAEEFFFDGFRPAAVVKVRSGIDADGSPVSWDYGVYAAGTRGGRHFYDIEHHRAVAYGQGFRDRNNVHPFNVGAWRAPACSTNTFARESQIDILAHKTGVDPLEYRRRHLDDERMGKVLEAAVEKFGWKPKGERDGHGYGLALARDAGAYVAHALEVAVDRDTGKVRVTRVVCAQDCGLVINPRGAHMQMEGCITMGLGYVLSEQLRFEGRTPLDKNFDTYQLPRFSWVPEIETLLVDTGIEEAFGGGEPAIAGMGAAVANAIFDACGARLYHLPMTSARVLGALRG